MPSPIDEFRRYMAQHMTPQQQAPWNPINRPPDVSYDNYGMPMLGAGESWDRMYGNYTGADKKAYWEKQRLLRQNPIGRPSLGGSRPDFFRL